MLHFMVELPDGTFAALPAQMSGSMVEPGDIPVYSPVYETGTQLPPPPPYELVSILINHVGSSLFLWRL